MAKYKTLETWLSEMLHGDTSDGVKRVLTALSCIHNRPNGGVAEVLTLDLAGKSWTVETLLRTFQGRAEHAVQDIPGRHHFEMRAYFDKQSVHAETHTFVVEDGEMKANGAQRRQSEDATANGLLAQLMRHNDTKDQAQNNLVSMIMQTSMEREKTLWARIGDMTREVNDAYTILRESLFQKSIAEHQMTMQQLQFARETERQNTMIAMAPSLINAGTGEEVIPDAGSDSFILDKAAEHFSEEKLNMAVAAGLLPKDMATMLAARFKRVAEKKQKEREALAKVPAGATGDTHSNILAFPGTPKKLGSGGGGGGGGEGSSSPANP
jgi:hypothetical protein